MDADSITIRPLETAKDFKACQNVQQMVWRSEPVDVVPAHLLITFRRHGGLVLGAFDPTGRMIGCLIGFAGRTAPDNPATAGLQWQHCSHMVGVIPEWRGHGVGYQLKIAQRSWALGQGFELVTWTFDPLEAVNASLNLGKLGAVCRCYLRDVYGELADGLSAGLPTDRFEVAWWVGSKHVQKRVERGWPERPPQDVQEAWILNPGRAGTGDWIEPGPVRQPEGEELWIEIPSRFQGIKAASMDLALAWRLNVREACETAFDAGYTACDVVWIETEGIPRSYYLLTTPWP